MLSLVPIFVFFAIGMLLRATGIARQEQAAFIFRLVFFVTLPALAFITIESQPLSWRSAALPVAGFFTNLLCAGLTLLYLRVWTPTRATAGAILLGASTANLTFVFPFILAVLGPDALAVAMLYDIGNAFFVATLAYAVATGYLASENTRILGSALRILRSPLFVAVIAAVCANLLGVTVPDWLYATLEPLGSATLVLILVALGISFSGARLRESSVIATVALRMIGGLIAGVLIVTFLGLSGEIALVIIAVSAAPIGFNAVTLTSIGGLDVDHATASLSLSVALGLVTTTALLLGAAHRFVPG